LTGKGFRRFLKKIGKTEEDRKEWTSQQIKPFTFSNSFQLFLKANTKYNCAYCIDIIKQHASGYDKLLLNLL